MYLNLGNVCIFFMEDVNLSHDVPLNKHCSCSHLNLTKLHKKTEVW